MDQIGLFFKCQSCSDYILTSNIQCPNGHQVCHLCFENLSHCPTCHQRVALSTRIPFLLTTNVDPILNVTGDSFDLLLPSLLRIAPALHPCAPDEMIFTGNKATNLHLNNMNNDSNNIMQKNNNLADQLLMANNCGEVEEALSRLMMLASMSSNQTPPTLPSPTTPLSSITTNSLNNNNTSLVGTATRATNFDFQSIIDDNNIHDSVRPATPTRLLLDSSPSSSITSTPLLSSGLINNNNNINAINNNNNSSVPMDASPGDQSIDSLLNLSNTSISTVSNNNQLHQRNIDGFPEF